MYWLYHIAGGIFDPQPGVKPTPPALEVQSFNHWTPREVRRPSTFTLPLAATAEEVAPELGPGAQSRPRAPGREAGSPAQLLPERGRPGHRVVRVRVLVTALTRQEAGYLFSAFYSRKSGKINVF